jgi:hypothetical protein
MTGTSGRPNAPWHAYLWQNHLFILQNMYFKESPVSTPQETLTFYQLDINKLQAACSDIKQVYPARDIKKTNLISLLLCNHPWSFLPDSPE